MTPRDPARIDRMIELLRQAWHRLPDQRLTQLVINIADQPHDGGSVYYLEDTVLERKLEAWAKSH